MLKANHHSELWSGRWYYTTERDDELSREIDCAALMDLLTVKFTSPRRRKNHECFVYGDISFKIGDSDESVPFFSRKREDAARIELLDKSQNFLTLPDLPGGFSPRFPKADRGWGHVRFTMSLREKKSSEGEDVLIAELQDYGIDFRVMGVCLTDYITRLPKEVGIGVGCCGKLGAPVRIEVKIRQLELPKEEGLVKKPRSSVLINAEIQAIHYLTHCYCCPRGRAVRTLYNNEEEVTVGNQLQLLRSIVCLPMHSCEEKVLTILVRPNRADKANYVLVHFPFELDNRSLSSNQEGWLTQDVPGAPFSVSIKFLY